MMSLALLLCVTCVDITFALGGDESAVEPLYFSLMVSSAPTLNTSGVLSTVDQALEGVHNDANLLPGYKLKHSGILDSQVTTFIAI